MRNRQEEPCTKDLKTRSIDRNSQLDGILKPFAIHLSRSSHDRTTLSMHLPLKNQDCCHLWIFSRVLCIQWMKRQEYSSSTVAVAAGYFSQMAARAAHMLYTLAMTITSAESAPLASPANEPLWLKLRRRLFIQSPPHSRKSQRRLRGPSSAGCRAKTYASRKDLSSLAEGSQQPQCADKLQKPIHSVHSC